MAWSVIQTAARAQAELAMPATPCCPSCTTQALYACCAGRVHGAQIPVNSPRSRRPHGAKSCVPFRKTQPSRGGFLGWCCAPQTPPASGDPPGQAQGAAEPQRHQLPLPLTIHLTWGRCQFPTNVSAWPTPFVSCPCIISNAPNLHHAPQAISVLITSCPAPRAQPPPLVRVT